MTACSRKIAYHEAGHAVVASALGFDVIEIVKRADGWATGVAFPEEPTISEHFLLAAWSMAGGAALAALLQDLGEIGEPELAMLLGVAP